ncbi:MAG: RNA-binding protein [Candidatus Thermofonsia Clade 1 bacterium]|uniref:RNA-binding protein KhpA n=1 Tax=Candidatus Thermofonsia Clade 1 bacterium TaxID=2364210 RepID=A0A2M8NZB6_9CHLR|nr:MAG: RNA-binding protein [Candidatus Thermofonsia Clade 1 bacterium]
MKELVEYVAKSLVDEPSAVRVTEHMRRGAIVIELHVAPSDMGRVIGKEGRIANALRALLRVASARTGKRVVLDIH